jgi:ketosteroid isomerase-like protein
MRDPLELVKASPAAVGRHDKVAWLDLFAEDAVIEDPVGGDAYSGKARLGAFWDVFIAPHRVTFHPRHDFVAGDRVVRHVLISTITGVDAAPLEVPAIIEYRVRDGRIASLRAFWEPIHAVGWYAGRGVRGIGGLLRHGGRMTMGLGVGSALGFGRSLVPAIASTAARAFVDRVAAEIRSGARAGWLDTVGSAALFAGGPSFTVTDPIDVWERALASRPGIETETCVTTGDHVAAVLSSPGLTLALIARFDRNQPAALTLLLDR